MQTKDRYWEGLFWDGFSPDAVGAVPLVDASSVDGGDPVLTAVLDEARRIVSDAGDLPAVDDYFVTVMDVGVAPTEADGDDGAGSAASAEVDAPGAEQPQHDAGGASAGLKSPAEIVVRLWHVHVFLGARDSGTGDPAAFNCDLHFAAADGKFLRRTSWDETDDAGAAS